MMWDPRVHAMATVVLLLTQASCSSPDPALYTIAPISGAEHSISPHIILLQQIGLERYLERPQIVRSSADYRLDIMENDSHPSPSTAEKR